MKEPKASALNGGRERGIGAGPIVAHVANVVGLTVLAFQGVIDGGVAVGAFLLTFFAVFAGDLYVQHLGITPDDHPQPAGEPAD